MSALSIGIDPGLDGGIVILSDTGSIISKHPMPTIKLGKGRVVDVLEITRLLTFENSATVYLEEASKHSPGVLAICSTWYTYGSIETILKLIGMRYQTVQPLKWQRRFWARPAMAKGDKFDTKAAALVAASKLWPNQDWLKGKQSIKPHDGMIDAALIAEYGRTREEAK